MIIRATHEEVQAYRASTAMNQSTLKTLMSGPEYFEVTTEEDEESKFVRDKSHFIIGSVAEMLATYPISEFNSRYCTSEALSKPSDDVCEILRRTYANCRTPKTVLPEDGEYSYFQSWEFRQHLYVSMNYKGYYSNRMKTDWKEDTRQGTLLTPQAIEYWNSLIAAAGRQEITATEHNIAKTIASNWLNIWPTSTVFTESPWNIIYYQLPIYFSILGVQCKALLDMMKIDTQAKTIQGFDMKTMSGLVRKFKQSARKFGYYIQASFYTEAIKAFQQLNKEYEDYTILPFTFIVESSDRPGVPFLFPCSEEALKFGKDGFPETYKMVYLKRNQIVGDNHHTEASYMIPIEGKKGFMGLLADYNFYKVRGFKVHRDMYGLNGCNEIQLTDLI